MLTCAFELHERLQRCSGDDEWDNGGELDPHRGQDVSEGERPLDGDAGSDDVGGIGGRPVVELSWLLAPGSSVEG